MSIQRCFIFVSSVLINLVAADAAVFLSDPSGELPGPGGYTSGTEFTVGSQPLSVAQLGAYDAGANGLVESHDVGLWDSANTLLGSVTVPSGTGATLAGTYRYTALATPVILLAN